MSPSKPIENRPNRSRRRVMFRVVVLAASSLLSLVLCELAFRATGARPYESAASSDWSEPDPIRGWRPRDGTYRLDVEQRLATIREGVRFTPGGSETENAPVLLLIGCSYTMGYGVRDDETFAALLQESLPHLRIVNLGTGGYGTHQSLLALEQYLDDHPDRPPAAVIYGYLEHHEIRNVAEPDWVLSLQTAGGLACVPPHTVRHPEGGFERRPMHVHRAWPFAGTSAIVHRIQRRLLVRQLPARTQMRRTVLEHLVAQMQELCSDAGTRLLVFGLRGDLGANPRHLHGARDSLRRRGDPEAADPGAHLPRERDRSGHPNERVHRRWAQELERFIAETWPELSVRWPPR